jgi:leucyl-tRNA synthetase
MAEYDFQRIERDWQTYWEKNQTFRAANPTETDKPKYYVLDMFPYPSGAGLHVGHPLGYIASDIVARYKRLQGYNVLHPMGFDAFGLPAEQYAVQTGQHPAVTTEQNIKTYKQQLRQLGLSYDWNREVRTSDPEYYKWTQWIFLQFFESWYNQATDKAEPLASLREHLRTHGTDGLKAVKAEEARSLSADDWNKLSDLEQQQELLHYRLAYRADTFVNWCPQLGTVLANEEVKDGLSERGGYPVERKLMQQWSLRITAYAERLLQGLDQLDWTDALKEMQRNWIGKSQGAEVHFQVLTDEKGQLATDLKIDNPILTVFTTRPDTLFGATFLSIAPEHEWASLLLTDAQREEGMAYIQMAKNRSERDRMSDVKTITGLFTGSFAQHPLTGERIPIWIADYVLAGYGTGAVMAVPGHDSRDYAFARHFNLPIVEVVEGGDLEKEAFESKDGQIINSDFLNGLPVKEAITRCINELESRKLGHGRTNYRLRDAICSRQRYWGEPIPIWYDEHNLPQPIPEEQLPLHLPEIDEYRPTETGEPPLGRAVDWKYTAPDGKKYEYELSTMPGWAGSSWYYLRYMDPHNTSRLVGEPEEAYWGEVDLYLGGSEHATGHLLYARFWYEFLKDRGFVTHDAPFRKLINQGMIQGISALINRTGANTYVTSSQKNNHQTSQLHVDVAMVKNGKLDLVRFKKWNNNMYSNSEFITETDGSFLIDQEVEKMSKSKFNVVNPDEIISDYGADTLRMYEMFLGPLEQSKPWNTNGIEGVSKFLKRLWRLYFNEQGNWAVTEEAATPGELKTLHKTIKKVAEDIDRFSFNTSVSTFMICVNELIAFGTRKRAILEPLTIILSPYAPHIAEELWQKLGNSESISTAQFPAWEERFLVEDTFEYPVSINGKTRSKLTLALALSKEEVEKEVLASEEVTRYFEGKSPKKVIVVPGRIVNVVI